MNGDGANNTDMLDQIRNEPPRLSEDVVQMGWTPQDLKLLRDPKWAKKLTVVLRGLGNVTLHPDVVDADEEPEFFKGDSRGTVHHTPQGVMKVEVSKSYGLLLNDRPVQLMNLSRSKYSSCTVEEIMKVLVEIKRVSVNCTVLDFLINSRRGSSGVDPWSLREAWRQVYRPADGSGPTGQVFFLGTWYEHPTRKEVRSLAFNGFSGEFTGGYMKMSDVVPPNSAVALLAEQTVQKLGRCK